MSFSLRKEVVRAYTRYIRPSVQKIKISCDVEVVRLCSNCRLNETDLVVCCLVRDAAYQVDSFIDYYQRLGARHIVIMDNGSVDDTMERALSWDGVTVLRTGLPYPVYKYGFKQYFLDRFGLQCWCLIADVDERFDYPASSRILMSQFLAYLNLHGYTAVMSQMLDLFPAGPIASWSENGHQLEQESRFYDLSRLRLHSTIRGAGNRFANSGILRFSGGVREDKFQMATAPALTKMPLLFRSKGAIQSPLSAHECRFARVADISCVLRHYKFHRDFVEQCKMAVERQNYHNGSKEYACYLKAMRKNSLLTLKGETSREFQGVDALVDEGFLVVSAEYEAFVESHCGRWRQAAA